MTDIAELALRVDALEVKTANDELDRLSGTSKRVDRDVAAFSANSSRSLEFVKTGVAALVAGFAGLSLSRSIKESIELNQRYKELGIAMEVVGRNVGVNSQQLNTTTAALEKMGISMIEARQTVTRLAASHIDLANAEKLADLARNAAIVGQINTSEALDRIVHGIRSAEVEVLKTIGITVQFDQAYKQLAAQLGKTTNELTQQEKQQARVNVVLNEAPALVGLYEAAMNNAGKQFRSTERLAENLKIKIGELFDETTKLAVRSYTNLLKELDNTFTDLTDSGELQSWGDQLAYTFAFLGDAARVAVSPVIILLRTVDAAIDRAKALASGDFAKSRQIGADFDEFLKGELKVITGSTALRDELRKQRVERDLLTSAVGRGATAVQKETEEILDNTGSFKQSRDERKEFINSLAKQAVEAGKSRIEIQRMEAALLGVSDAAEPYLRIIENQAIAEEDLRVSRQKQADDLRRIESITQSVRTKQEVYNDTVKELDDLLSKGLGMEAYNRALSTAREELTKTETKTREFWDTNEQIWIQGVRNVQTSLANGLFNVFDDGLSGMVNGVKRAVGQMIAEFASIKILQGSGIAGLLGLGSTAAMASGGGSGGLGALSSISNIIGSGFGVSNLIGSGISGLGSITGIGSLTAFGQAFTGDAIAGFAGQAGAFGASAGSAFSAVAAPALAIAAGTMIGSTIGGNKRIGGMSATTTSLIGSLIGGPLGGIIGGGINAIFGRSRPKFENEALVGNVSASGFEGVLNQAFREKGGLARSDRVSNFITDTDTGNLLNQFGRLSESGNIPGALRDSATDPAVKRALEVGKFLDEAFGSIGDTLKITADKLGLSSDALNNFSAELDLVSEKGETLSEAQISEEITRISDAMIETLIPNLDELSKKGETSADTLNRLNAQFSVLESAAMLFGNTAEQAAEKVRALGIDGQSAFIESLGGVQVAATEIQEFYDIVFTDSQKLENTKNQILDVLKPLGVDFVPTLEQLYEAVESGNPELIQAAFKVDKLVKDVINLEGAADSASESISKMVDDVIQTAIPKEFNDAFSSVAFGSITEAAGALDGLNSELKEFQSNTDLSAEEIKKLSGAFDEFAKMALAAVAKERREFTAGRRDAQEGRLPDPTIATTIGGKIFTETEIRAMQQADVGNAADSATALIKEQIARAGNDQQLIRDLNATLEFIKFQSGQSNISETATRLSDEELARQAAAQLKALNEAERVQRNTSFNGAVQFAFPKGTNESADAADRARLSQLDVFKSMMADPAMSVSSAFSDLTEAARNLADELLLGDKSILSVFQKTSEAQRQYNEIIDRARSGNATSGELSGGVNNLLDAQLNSASTKFEFDKSFANVVNDLRSIGQTAEDKRAEEQKKSMAELKAEIKQLREDLNAANVAIAKSTAKTADVLDRWSVVGLPATEA